MATLCKIFIRFFEILGDTHRVCLKYLSVSDRMITNGTFRPIDHEDMAE